MMLWLDDYAVRKPVNKNYHPLTQPVKRFVRSVNWWGLLGIIACIASAVMVITAFGEVLNLGTGVVR